MGYELDNRLSILGWGKIFILSTIFRESLAPIQPPVQQLPGAVSPGVKRQAREADHSPPSNAEVPYVSMEWCLIN
jgi:hypothetical protein